MSAETIINKGIVTERSVAQQQQGKYTFAVNIKANKVEIRKAIEELFKVQVQSVHTLTMKGKKRALRRRNSARTSILKTREWKKAIVTLQPGQSIELLKA